MKKAVILMAAIVMLLGLSMPAHAFFIDFENGLGKDQQPIINITGVSFEITGGYNWIYGDSTTGNWNTRSIDLGYSKGSAAYQHYGNVFAFLGIDNNAGAGKVDFTNNDGTWFKTGYASNSNFYLEGYDTQGQLIASTFGGGNLYGADMGWLQINAPQGKFFDYVIVHDTGNYFIVDNMSGNASGIPYGNKVVPEPATMSLLGLGLLGVLGLRKKRV